MGRSDGCGRSDGHDDGATWLQLMPLEGGRMLHHLKSRGLGLALVRQAVRRHSGSIDVTNQRGAVFTVTLPGLGDDRAGVR